MVICIVLTPIDSIGLFLVFADAFEENDNAFSSKYSADRGGLLHAGIGVVEGGDQLRDDGWLADLTEGLSCFGTNGGDGGLQGGAKGVEDQLLVDWVVNHEVSSPI
jgi:hypothetical protein